MPVSKSWQEKCAALEDAFRQLPRWREETATGIPYEDLIPGIGRQLMMMSPRHGPPPENGDLPPELRHSPVLTRNAHTPKVKSTASAKRELASLARKTEALVEALDDLSRTGLDALNYRQDAIRRLTQNLRILWVYAKMAKVPQILNNTGRGAPKKVQEKKISRVVAIHYFGLTGKKPTMTVVYDKAGGEFFVLLRTVFEILGIKASAEAQARAACRDWPSYGINSVKTSD